MTGAVVRLGVAIVVAAAAAVALLAAAAGPGPGGQPGPCQTAAPPRAVVCVVPATGSPR